MEVDSRDLKIAVRRLDTIFKGQSSATLPVLRQVVVFTYENQLRFFATDLEVRLGLTVHAVGAAEFDLLIAFADLKAAVAQLSGRVEVKVRELNTFYLGPFTMRSEFQLDDYPLIDGRDFKEEFIKVAEGEEPGLSQVLRGVLTAVCVDKNRPQLAGVLWDVEKQTFVATDGHRLHCMPSRTVMTDEGEKMPSVILPTKGVQVLLACSGKDNLQMSRTSSRQIRFEGRDFTLVMKETDGAFPSWDQVVPVVPCTLKVPRRMLFDIAKKARKVDSEGDGYAVLTEHGQYLDFVMIRSSLQPVTCAVKLPAVDSNLPRRTRFSMNPRYIVDAIDRMDGDLVAIHYSEHLAPVMFRDTGTTELSSVVMPVRGGDESYHVSEDGIAVLV